MDTNQNYSIHLDERYGFLKLIDIGEVERSVQEEWFNQTLCRVNDCVVRVGVFKKGEFHWHKHDKEDEFFFVLEGKLVIDFKDRTVELAPKQGIVVPRGVKHRPRAPERTLVLMVEAVTVTATGDA